MLCCAAWPNKKLEDLDRMACYLNWLLFLGPAVVCIPNQKRSQLKIFSILELVCITLLIFLVAKN